MKFPLRKEQTRDEFNSIYIVDDEQTIREGITMALEADYKVEAFSNAETAIEAIKR